MNFKDLAGFIKMILHVIMIQNDLNFSIRDYWIITSKI